VHSIAQLTDTTEVQTTPEIEDAREQDVVRNHLYEKNLAERRALHQTPVTASEKPESVPHSLIALKQVEKAKLLRTYGQSIIKKTSARHTGKFSIEYKMRALRRKFPTLMSNLSNQDITKIGTEIRAVQKPMVLGHSLDRLKKRKVVSDLRKKHLSRPDILDVKKIIGTP
jgi:hypothetical protein